MFHKIDMEIWPRAEVFYYFSKMAPTSYSLTADVDVTRLLRQTRERGIRFFPAYLWLVTKNLSRQQAFTFAVKDGVPGYYDSLTPLYATWHEDTKTFSFLWTEYSDDFGTFYGAYLEHQHRYGQNHGVLARQEMPPENAYTVSALPWVSFSHFAVHGDVSKPYFFPSVEAGKYHRVGDRVMMPLSLTCHHATTDGWHISEFLKELQWDMDDFEKFLEGKHESVCDGNNHKKVAGRTGHDSASTGTDAECQR